MGTRARRWLLGVLTAVFFAQTWLVYSDTTGRRMPPLSPRAAQGQQLWFANNCQACHQLYGFGGFLGPDLTNLASRLSDRPEDPTAAAAALAERYEAALTTGSVRMPAFHFDPEERLALASFLEELDRTGVGQTKIREAKPPRELFAELIAALALTDGLGELEAEGLRLVDEAGCIDCHLPNAKSAFRAPDLTRVHTTIDPARVATVLVDGIPEKGMVRLDLDGDAILAVTAFLAWLERNGQRMRQAFEQAEASSDGSLRGLPWFEY